MPADVGYGGAPRLTRGPQIRKGRGLGVGPKRGKRRGKRGGRY